MIDPFFFFLFTILLVLILIGIIFLVRHLRRNVLNPMGKGSDQKTMSTLWQFAVTRGFKVLTHIDIHLNGKTVHIENLLIGYFGLLLVHTCGVRGEYYGTLDGGHWTIAMEDGRKRMTIPNPVAEQVQAVSMLRALLTKHKITGYAVDHVVYLSSKSKKTSLYITNGGEILLPGKLRGYLQKTKFERDTGLDVEKVAAILAEHAAQAKEAK